MSQDNIILDYLQQGYSITPLEALEKFSCFRLGARIWELKKQGYNIQSEIIKDSNGKHYSKYKLIINDNDNTELF